ncbi:hypothetical protein QF044_001209 [Chryseobacterium sp. W4I1]|nr:hypothetical protein [Chryseobacterium sp. W4I1]
MFIEGRTVNGSVYFNINNICSVERVRLGTLIRTSDGKEVTVSDSMDVIMSRINSIK